MKRFLSFASGLLLALVCLTGQAFAAVDLTAVEVDMTTYDAAVAIVLVALALIWPIRKLIKLFNRS